MWGDIIWKMLLCLILSALLGFIIGWLLRSLSCRKRCDELETNIGERDEEIARLRASLSKSKTDASRENASDDAEIAALRKQVATLEADLKSANERHTALETDLKGWETKAASFAAVPIAANDGETDKLRAEIDSLKLKLEETEGERAFLLDRVKRAESGETLRVVPMEQRDDLELVHGIGPVIERMLYDMGVYYFRDIAKWDDAKIEEISNALPQFKNRIQREGWIESAKEEHFKKYGERL